ncbi:MAG: hypothetical protein HY827_10250 [Actinobacteria bacterium]|nr:hypothetical protein [Actinomycetota bacterium]
MNQFELPLPLAEVESAQADAYDLRYPDIEISPGRKAWRGRREFNLGRVTESELKSAPQRSQDRCAILFHSIVMGEWKPDRCLQA